MQIGYARISTHNQNLELQNNAFAAAGCEKIFTDVASGAAANRDGPAEAIAHLRTGDVLFVWRLDRLGRSLKSTHIRFCNQAETRCGARDARIM